MTETRLGERNARALTLVGGVLLIAGCRHAAPPHEPVPAALPAEQLMAPPTTGSTSPRTAPGARPSAGTDAAADTARERHVDVDTHGADVDVRSLLDFVAKAGDFKLVYAPGVNKRVRVTLIDVPASVALRTLLSLADLTIESATPETGVPGSTSVVFYELPVKIDSLSTDAIMTRFGVGRAIAEMIVRNRTDRP